MRYDFAVIGGGIVGLATAYALGQRYPDALILVLEKEEALAQHQTGRNSGVIHSGIYYAPGSLKARLCQAGNVSIPEFCDEHGIPYDRCGKVIVATRPEELPGLEKLRLRAGEHGLPVRSLNAEEVREIEPHVDALAGLHVASTGIVDYTEVCLALAREVEGRGGKIRLGTRVEALHRDERGYRIETNAGPFAAHYLVNCAGLHSDRIARMAGSDPGCRIVPFRGEYYELRPEKRHLVKHLIYPVPNPDFPFLGVHFTRMIDGSVHAGPNAVLAFAREGYHKTKVDLRDLGDALSYSGFLQLARKNVGEGAKEMWRSFSKPAFVRSLQALIPEVTENDVIPSEAGVRAQALTPDGKLVDDFLLIDAPAALHVCNAPSPAATSSLEIGKTIAARVRPPAHLKPVPVKGLAAEGVLA
ncbi:L-2-hydroxyglutarate oxidase [Deinococcus aestuarii]|uniref:L-2-hydroxyglutarate oxidase n=1 Tax=Deinococcus aestuarii TaxID=2774531 RepID=UPI001C0E88E3